jgi:ABC-type dipeptide/oligopeptide/nickel transport system permease subunit
VGLVTAAAGQAAPPPGAALPASAGAAGASGARARPAARWPATLIAGTALLLLFIGVAAAAPAFGNPLRQDLLHGLTRTGLPLGMSWAHPLGTDTLGRSELARLAFGIRTSVIVALAANLTSIAAGAAVGLLAGFFRGPVEAVLMRVTDIGLALPYTLAALVIAGLMTAGLTRVIVIITALFWAYPARLVYGEVLRLRRRGFVEAAEAMGAGGLTVVRRHLAPHVFTLLVTYSPLNAASAVVFEATLSYLGAGINPPAASLGNMISDGQSAISYAPHLLLVPAAAILLITMSFLLIGEGLKARNPDLARVSWLGR